MGDATTDKHKQIFAAMCGLTDQRQPLYILLGLNNKMKIKPCISAVALSDRSRFEHFEDFYHTNDFRIFAESNFHESDTIGAFKHLKEMPDSALYFNKVRNLYLQLHRDPRTLLKNALDSKNTGNIQKLQFAVSLIILYGGEERDQMYDAFEQHMLRNDDWKPTSKGTARRDIPPLTKSRTEFRSLLEKAFHGTTYYHSLISNIPLVLEEKQEGKAYRLQAMNGVLGEFPTAYEGKNKIETDKIPDRAGKPSSRKLEPAIWRLATLLRADMEKKGRGEAVDEAVFEKTFRIYNALVEKQEELTVGSKWNKAMKKIQRDIRTTTSKEDKDRLFDIYLKMQEHRKQHFAEAFEPDWSDDPLFQLFEVDATEREKS